MISPLHCRTSARWRCQVGTPSARLRAFPRRPSPRALRCRCAPSTISTSPLLCYNIRDDDTHTPNNTWPCDRGLRIEGLRERHKQQDGWPRPPTSLASLTVFDFATYFVIAFGTFTFAMYHIHDIRDTNQNHTRTRRKCVPSTWYHNKKTQGCSFYRQLFCSCAANDATRHARRKQSDHSFSTGGQQCIRRSDTAATHHTVDKRTRDPFLQRASMHPLTHAQLARRTAFLLWQPRPPAWASSER